MMMCVTMMCERGTNQMCPPAITVNDDRPEDPVWWGAFHLNIYRELNDIGDNFYLNIVAKYVKVECNV